VRVFRNLFEAISSLEKGKALVSKYNYMFNPELAFYQEDIFGDRLEIDKYKKNRDLGYRLLGSYISEFGVKITEDEDVFYNLGHLSSYSLVVRSDDLLRVLERVDDSVKDLRAFDREPIDFVKASIRVSSSLTDSFDFLVFSNFSEDQYKDGDNLLISGVYSRENTTDFFGFWEKLLFGKPSSYEKLLSVFDEDLKNHVFGSISLYDDKGSNFFSLPFGSFYGDTKFLFFEKGRLLPKTGDFEKKVGLVSFDRRLSSTEISEWFSRFIANAYDRGISPRIIGCLDFYYGVGPKSEENVVLIPVELNIDNRKVLILHAFFVVDLLDDYKFYVDVREEGRAFYSDYTIILYPNKDREERGKFILSVSEHVSFMTDGLEGVDIHASMSFKSSSVGEIIEVEGKKELVPRGVVPKYDSLQITTYDFSIDLDEKFDLSVSPPDNGEELSLVRHGNSYVLKGKMWKNKRFVSAIRSGIERSEDNLLSSLPNSCFLLGDGKKNTSFRDKKFLLELVELILRESFRSIKERLDKCGNEEKCEFRVYVDIDENKYGKDIINITRISYPTSSNFIYAIPENPEERLREIFGERALYPKLVDSPDKRVEKLCFENGKGNKVEIDTGLPLHEDKVKDLLKRKSYLGFINWSLKDVGGEREDRAEVYSLFLDLVPRDPSSVMYLYSWGVYDNIMYKLEKVIKNLEEALDQGTIELNINLNLGVKATEKEGKICILPGGEDSFIGELTLGDFFMYKQGKSLLAVNVFGPEEKW
jgi:hypothetical protein